MSTLLRYTLLPAALLLGSCASQIPVNIREAPPANPSLQQVRAKPADYRSQQVRWGGEILAVENRQDATWLTLLARPLARDGRPEGADNSLGRFIAKVPQFLDPKVYQAERQVTVRGTLAGTETRQVGKFPYLYPLVDATDWYLWPPPVSRAPGDYYPGGYYDPFFYDPWFYDPWYRYPYYPTHIHKDKD